MSDGIQALLDKKAKEQEQKTKILDIRSLMTNLKFTAEQAMDALSIPQSQCKTYAGLIKQM